MTYTLLIDNGHGKNTPGKCSPILDGEGRLLEWEFTRKVAKRCLELAPQYGLNVVILVPEDKDIPLGTRAARANAYIKAHPKERCIFLSIHGNAAGNGNWMSARGWEAWTTVGKTNSDRLAECLYNAARTILPEGTKIRTDKSDGDQDREKNFTVIFKTNCPAVLTENLFYDNKEDCKYMLSEAGIESIAKVHLAGAVNYWEQSTNIDGKGCYTR